MSTADKTTTDTSNEITHAVLERGRVYMFGGKDFMVRVPHPVTQAEIDHLKDNAVDTITLENEGEFELRQKFKFLTTAEAKAYVAKQEQRSLTDQETTSNARPRQRERVRN